MIKMVACDVDGTLLMKGENEISTNIISSIKRIADKGILFVIASGRSYTDLKRLFKAVENDVVFVCHDGALIMYKGSILAKTPIDHRAGFTLMKKAYKNGAIPVVYGAYMTYILKDSGDFGTTLRHAMNNHVLEVDCLDALSDDYLKLGIYKVHEIEPKTGISSFVDFNLVYESREWCEYVAPGVHKGSAVAHLQKRFAVAKDETMVFGDNRNDLEMFEQAGVSYAVDWAADEIKARCGYTTANVVGTLESVLK